MSKVSFENPPLNELVLGVQFSAPVISTEDIFNFYSSFLKTPYPRIQESDLLPVTIEKTDRPNEVRMVGLGTRKLFISTANDTLVQIQSDRFLLNWRKLDTNNMYPHFDNVYEKFLEQLNNLFSTKDELKRLINQYEITYVDHLTSDSLELHRFKLNEMFVFMPLKAPVKSADINFTIPTESVGGNLNIKIKSGVRNIDRKPVIVLETTCRGYSADISMNDWFRKSREILVNFFNDSISSQVKNSWNPK